MKILVSAFALCLPVAVEAGVGFSNVPTAHVQSETYSVNDAQARDQAYAECTRDLTEARRLLIRKSVEIILQENPCTELKFTDTAMFLGSIHFLN